MKKRWIEPVMLSGATVVSEPLSLEHLEGIQSAVKAGELWKLWFASVPSPETAEASIRTAFNLRENAGWMPFIVLKKATDKVVGSTCYCIRTFACRSERSDTP